MTRLTLPRKSRLVTIMALAFVLIPVIAANARFIRPDLAKIPVARLVANLEQMVQKKPKDANLRFNLARVHAMAFAQKADSAQIWKGKEKNGAWFGYTPKAVPFKVKMAKSEAEQKAAQEHLKKALQRYEEVLKTKPDHLAALLGHAWLMEQSGKKMDAVKEYRKTIDTAWKKEGKNKFAGLKKFITVEAAGYLTPLLDKEKDAKEIQTINERVAHLKKLPRAITPVAIPLRDGLSADDLLNRSAKVKFDADGTGLKRPWTWINKNAGWLVYDKRGDGKIDSALQMFGNVTFWLFWDNGYEAMRTLDNDGDGFLTGAELNGLALWRDANANGISEAGEVKSLQQWGISKLSCDFEQHGSRDCAAYSPAGVWFQDGAVRPTFDLILRQR